MIRLQTGTDIVRKKKENLQDFPGVANATSPFRKIMRTASMMN